MLSITLLFATTAILACVAIIMNVQKKNLVKSLKPIMLVAVLAIVFTGCCDRKSIINGTFSSAELQTIRSNNKAYFDSCCNPTHHVHFNDTGIVNPGQPITLKDTACIFFSAGPMTQNGATITEWQITYGSAGQYSCYIGITNSSSTYQITQSNGKVFDLRYSVSFTGYPAVAGSGAGTEVVVSPWNP